jgi:transcriptional regulator with XRE-family HTH domain
MMTNEEIREGAARLCARKGVDPEALLSRRETAALLGFSVPALAQMANRRTGPTYKIAFGAACYRAGAAAEWFFAQFKDPETSPRALAMQKVTKMRRERGDVLGRPRGAKAMQAAARVAEIKREVETELAACGTAEAA